MLGNRIQALLGHHKQPVRALADHCGVSEQTVYNWLKDDAQPRDGRKKEIAAFFGITPQDLEYGPVLSLVRLPVGRFGNGKLSADVAEKTADLIMSGELNSLPPKSVEYMEGMRNRIILKLSGKITKPVYKSGTCQLDAYEAGYVHGEKLISE